MAAGAGCFSKSAANRVADETIDPKPGSGPTGSNENAREPLRLNRRMRCVRRAAVEATKPPDCGAGKDRAGARASIALGGDP